MPERTPTAAATPASLRRLNAAMEQSGLKLKWVAARAGVSYHRASEVLNGHRNSPVTLGKLRRVIEESSRALQQIA